MHVVITSQQVYCCTTAVLLMYEYHARLEYEREDSAATDCNSSRSWARTSAYLILYCLLHDTWYTAVKAKIARKTAAP